MTLLTRDEEIGNFLYHEAEEDDTFIVEFEDGSNIEVTVFERRIVLNDVVELNCEAGDAGWSIYAEITQENEFHTDYDLYAAHMDDEDENHRITAVETNPTS